MKQRDQSTGSKKVRLDKWLWAARFYKTRTLAKEAVEGGKVHLNGQRCKPGKEPKAGDTVKLRQGWDEKTVTVQGVSDRRLGAVDAQKLYEETRESIEARLLSAEQRKASRGTHVKPLQRPDKKQRRELMEHKRFFDDEQG